MSASTQEMDVSVWRGDASGGEIQHFKVPAAMMVNGVPRWTCRTHVKKVLKDNAITIAPLRNLPVIKDLAADMDPFFDKWVAAGGVHHPTKSRDDAIETLDPAAPARVETDTGIECINCSIFSGRQRCSGPGPSTSIPRMLIRTPFSMRFRAREAVTIATAREAAQFIAPTSSIQ